MNTLTAGQIKKDTTINVLLNILLNGAIAWMLLKSSETLLWGGDKGFAGDMIGTAFFMPFIVALIVIAVQRKKVATGKREALTLDRSGWGQKMASRFPQSLWLNALLFGFAGALVLAPLSLAGLWVFDIHQFSPLHYSLFKGIWAGAIAAVLVPVMIMVGLRKTS